MFHYASGSDIPGWPPQDASLIESIYEAAVEPDGLDPLLARLQQQFRAHSVRLVEFPQGTRTPAARTLQARAGAPGEQPRIDPFEARIAAAPEGRVIRCHDPDLASAPSRPPSEKIQWSMGGNFLSGPDGAAMLVVHAGLDAGPFDDDAAMRMRLVLPHFRRAWLLRRKVQRRLAAAESAADLLRGFPVGYFLTDAQGRCIDSNEAFHHCLGRIGIQLVLGRVRFGDPARQAAWEHALQETFATGVERTLRVPALPAFWRLLLKPWSPAGPGPRLVLVLVNEQRELSQEPAPLPSAGLTRAEMEVLALLLTGAPAKTVAARRGASINTVRSQIMAILEKTGFRSQRELIASFGASGYSAFEASSFGASVASQDAPRD